jgi:hypothetical protein
MSFVTTRQKCWHSRPETCTAFALQRSPGVRRDGTPASRRIPRGRVTGRGLFVQVATDLIFRIALGEGDIQVPRKKEKCSQRQEGGCRSVERPVTLGEDDRK